jgi:hypothetical protein
MSEATFLSRRGFIGALASFALVRPSLALPDRSVRVEASGQTGTTLVLARALGVPLLVGTIVTIEGVQAWSTRYPFTGRLRQFVVTREAKPGERVLHIYPGIVPMQAVALRPENVNVNRYATVVAPPARGAEIREVPASPPTLWRVSGTGSEVTYTRLE